MSVKLSALALKKHTRLGVADSGASGPIVEEQLLSADDACLCFPHISPKQVYDKCRASPETIGQVMFRLEDVADMFLEQCGCVEEYQEAIVNDFEKDIPSLVKLLPYVNRSWRLAELARAFYKVAKNDLNLSFLEEEEQYSFTHRIFLHWMYKYCCYVGVRNINSPTDDKLVVSTGIEAVTKLATKHSVLTLIIGGTVRLVQAEDYFTAVLEYEEIWKGLYQSTRPNRDDIYGGLERYLRLSSPTGLLSNKKWTKGELRDAMVRFGIELVRNITETLEE